MQGFKRGSSVLTQFSVPQIRKKVSNSFSAVEDTFLSTKETFERHKVVFTILTSIASVGTAWVANGYTGCPAGIGLGMKHSFRIGYGTEGLFDNF
ncbi:hypothetical protein HanOQP8_Chr04g0167761 [Helianthus annuus]|nr:hypothetical protein HanOQP8_Chr04g0167761 [Helianthus annuus]